MQVGRVVSVESPGRRGSGYLVTGRLVLTSAHATPEPGRPVEVFRPAAGAVLPGVVRWRGDPGGVTDAALVQVDGAGTAGRGPGFGRLVTTVPEQPGQAVGYPAWVQRPDRAAEIWQPSGVVNPASRYVGDRYVLSLSATPPDGDRPWAGLSGGPLFCGDLLTGVIAVDPAGARHGHLEAVPAVVLLRDAGFRAVLAEHGRPKADAEPVEFAGVQAREPAAVRSPTALLRARAQVVGFRGRHELLAALRGWCAGAGFGAWLLYGPGGQGKTRVAQELADRLAADGWATVWLDETAGPESLEPLGAVAVPLLLVLDYAESRPAQLPALWRALARHDGEQPIRLLMLARTAGDWWSQARADRTAEDLLADARVAALPVLEPAPGGPAAGYRDAVTDLAPALRALPGYGDHDWPAVARRLAEAPPEIAAGASALTVQMRALADLLDTAGRSPPAAAAGPVEERLLTHERRYWRHTAAARGLLPGLSEPTLIDVLAAAMLFGGDDRAQGDRLLARLPVLADQSRDRRNAVRAWLVELYPGRDASGWAALQPDRLTEYLVGRHLADDPELPEPLIDAVSDAQLARFLTVYARAAAHPAFAGRLDESLTGLCVRHADRLTGPAVDTATRVENAAPLVAALERLAGDPELDLVRLRELSNRVPMGSRNLLRVGAVISQRLVDAYRMLALHDPDAHLGDLIRSLHNVGVRLSELGRHAPARAAIDDAVRLARGSDALLPLLGTAVDTRSNVLSELGHPDEALAAAEEAVQIWSRLADAEPGAHRPELGGALNNLATRLGQRGWYEAALAAADRAVRLYPPGGDRPLLGALHNTRSNLLGELGRGDEAVAAVEEAVRIRRRLADRQPDVHRSDLAGSLHNLALQLGRAGRHEDARAAAEEAVVAYRELARRPLGDLAGLARALDNLAEQWGALDLRERQVAALQEVAAIWLHLAPAQHLHCFDVADVSYRLAVELAALGRTEQARIPAGAAVAIWEQVPHGARSRLDQARALLDRLSPPGEQ